MKTWRDMEAFCDRCDDLIKTLEEITDLSDLEMVDGDQARRLARYALNKSWQEYPMPHKYPFIWPEFHKWKRAVQDNAIRRAEMMANTPMNMCMGAVNFVNLKEGCYAQRNQKVTHNHTTTGSLSS